MVRNHTAPCVLKFFLNYALWLVTDIGVGACGQKNLSCVMCAPRSWNVESRKILADAAEKAGWNVLQVINEAPSALLAYHIGFERPPQDMYVLLFVCRKNVSN